MSNAKHKAEPIILWTLFIVYLITLFKITIFRDSNSDMQNVNLIPFTTIFEYLQSVQSGIGIIEIANVLGNLIIFFPLGYMSALLFPKMANLTRILIVSFGFSVAIEIIQYIFACGTTDIDDVILNTLGGVTGYGIYVLVSRFLKPKKYAIFISTLMIAFTCIGFFSFTNYTFLVALPTASDTRIRDEQSNTPVPNTDSTTDAQSNDDEAEWYLILVNKWNYIPDDYEVELIELSNGQSVDKRIYPALQELFDAARSDGIYPIVASGYRTAKKQQSLLDEKIAEYRAEGYSGQEAITKAEAWVAIPGTSEHQLGIAVDINADDIQSTGDEVYKWLNQNAYKFGFIKRYPSDKTEITGVINEPWHYRYVGIDTATKIYNQGICLEEYLDRTN